jgi:RsmE family RNA methyltransferase
MNVDMYIGDLEMTTQVIEDERPPIIYADTYINLSEKKDLCLKYFKKWHDLGCKIVVKASTVADAITAEEAGVDAVILKGWEGGEIAVMIGPEGDFSKAEADLALQSGFVPVHLGDSRLRTETAALTAVSAVYLHYME